MNHQQIRAISQAANKIADLDRRLSEMERKYEAMCGVFDILINRKAGRPSRADVEHLEQLQAEMNGTPH